MQMTRGELAARIASLCEEIRRYPGPIARCDEHLRALLQQRKELTEMLEQQPAGCTPLGIWDNEGGFHAA
ncbi:MAG: hypothetical protein ACT4P4_06035 [Betaproteobacteria bacterium]